MNSLGYDSSSWRHVLHADYSKCNWEVEDTSPPLKHSPDSAPSSSSASASGDNRVVKVSYLTEQTSHHPPVSAFYIDCPEKGIVARGFDQLSAKFTGTSIRVIAGAHNLGIFITLQKRDNEEYQLTHPAAYLGGLLRGLYKMITDVRMSILTGQQAPSASQLRIPVMSPARRQRSRSYWSTLRRGG